MHCFLFEAAHVKEWEEVDPECCPENYYFSHQPVVASRLVCKAGLTGNTSVDNVAVDETGDAKQ